MTRRSLTQPYKNNCNNCIFKQDEFCTYFEYVRKEKQVIPENVIDKGCKQWSDSPLLIKIIEMFEGEIV